MIGRRIQHYLIVEEIGKGGMGVVYKARDDRLRRDVAIKMLRNVEETGGREHDRILSEARAACALNHPGIVTVYDVCEAEGHLFIVMELVRGEALPDLIQAGPLDLRSTLRLSLQMAEALGVAHTAGILHRDIKPQNILIQPDGRARLLDFGIARMNRDQAGALTLPEDAPTRTLSDAVAGTVPYMPPEQLKGEPLAPTADLYSLGVVLYEAATGSRPFRGPSNAELINQILSFPPPALRIAGDLQERFGRIVSKLLAKRPEDRFPTAAELHRDLTNLQRDLDLEQYLSTAGSRKYTVAVLPFRLLTPGAEDEYLSIALADAVINHLSTSSDLLVRPTGSIVKYAHAEPETAARELNVDFLVEGSVQKSGPQLRVHVQARRVSDGNSLASLRFESVSSELFDLQDRLGRSILKTLAPDNEAAVEPVPPASNPLAYELYLRAGERISRLNRWDLLTAIDMLTKATALEPLFADAWARLAEACVQMAVTFESKPEWFARAEDAIRSALQLDPSNADALCAEGQLLWTPHRCFANEAALNALNRSLAINPGCHQAQVWRGLILLHLGLHDEARRALFAALVQNPDDARAMVFIGQNALYHGDFDEANEYHVRALAADPGSIWANLFFPTVPLYSGRVEGVMDKIRIARQMLPEESTVDSLEALLLANYGEHTKARALIEKALQGGKPLLHSHHLWHNAAGVYAMGGDAESALHWLHQAAVLGLPNHPLYALDPHLRPLSDRPDFQQFMSGVKTEWLKHQRQFGEGTLASSARDA
jgi:serine/threonine protein kinase